MAGGLPDFAAMDAGDDAGDFPEFEERSEDEAPTALSITALPRNPFRVLGAFVPVYRALAVLLAVASVGGILYAIYATVALKEAAERGGAIAGGMALFIVGALAAGLHFVIAELIRVALAIEERTR
jgi:hypothetical protein